MRQAGLPVSCACNGALQLQNTALASQPGWTRLSIEHHCSVPVFYALYFIGTSSGTVQVFFVTKWNNSNRSQQAKSLPNPTPII